MNSKTVDGLARYEKGDKTYPTELCFADFDSLSCLVVRFSCFK